MNNTPIEEYYFWKSLIEDKLAAGETVPSEICELLALAETKMTHFLTEKYHLSDSSTSLTTCIRKMTNSSN